MLLPRCRNRGCHLASTLATLPRRPFAQFLRWLFDLCCIGSSPSAAPSLCAPCILHPAGRSGRVFTLLRHEDVRHFKDMLRKADNTFVKDHRLDKGALEAVRDDVDTALERMAAVLQSESEAVRPGQLAAAATAAPAAGADVGAGAAKAGAAAAGQGQERQQQAERGTASKRRKVTGVPEFSLLV